MKKVFLSFAFVLRFDAIPEPGLPTGYIVLICVLLFVVVALGVIYCMFKYCKRKVSGTWYLFAVPPRPRFQIPVNTGYHNSNHDQKGYSSTSKYQDVTEFILRCFAKFTVLCYYEKEREILVGEDIGL
ncbi:hypothetical protein ROHU_000975 [Labeo rohita]|uniref:Uncharacterized protein n=1 Tax=Labeo rohita TaxID=84645 RepID=A0A498P4Z1_LABRO|nr:hypothetical protein ROHU_000975 [Labeo rohita]